MLGRRLTLTPEGVEVAYRHGIFPMADGQTGEVLWFRPDPRAIIPLDGFHVSRSLARTIRRGQFEIRVDSDFDGVMRGCADRPEGSWIDERFVEVYGALHRAGAAHSVEACLEGRLGGPRPAAPRARVRPARRTVRDAEPGEPRRRRDLTPRVRTAAGARPSPRPLIWIAQQWRHSHGILDR